MLRLAYAASPSDAAGWRGAAPQAGRCPCGVVGVQDTYGVAPQWAPHTRDDSAAMTREAARTKGTGRSMLASRATRRLPGPNGAS